MSNFSGLAFNPATKRVETADFSDKSYEKNGYSVRFSDGSTFFESDVLTIKGHNDRRYELRFRESFGVISECPKTGDCSGYVGQTNPPKTFRASSLDEAVNKFHGLVAN